MPLFSLIIPTRNRPELANRTIARLLEQTYRDYEVVVLENSDHPSLGGWEQQDTRIRVASAPRTLSMPDNWERGPTWRAVIMCSTFPIRTGWYHTRLTNWQRWLPRTRGRP